MGTAAAAREARRGTVLVVEDDAAVAGFVHTLLEDAGYAAPVLGVADADAVRVAIGQLEPDCVLLDSRRRGEYGESWADAAWAHARQRAVPVVMLTASRAAAEEARVGESERSRAADFFAVVEKPFNLDDLLDTVERAVGSVAAFDRSVGAEATRTATFVAKLEAAGAREIRPGTRREWATFYAGDALTLLYWSQRDGVYFVLRQPAEGGAMRQVGRFHDLDIAVALATLPARA